MWPMFNRQEIGSFEINTSLSPDNLCSRPVSKEKNEKNTDSISSAKPETPFLNANTNNNSQQSNQVQNSLANTSSSHLLFDKADEKLQKSSKNSKKEISDSHQQVSLFCILKL